MSFYPLQRACPRLAALLAASLLLLACGGCTHGARAQKAPTERVRVVARLPHSTASYTEGLFFRDGRFYEGTGLTGHSELLVEDPATGRVLQQHTLPPELFGEGIVDWGPYLYEWTWQSHVGFVLNRTTLQPVRQFTYSGEGWGMTRNDRELITSDGTAILRFRDPDTFGETHHLVVHDGRQNIAQLNELEWVKGEIYANVWHDDRIARISPRDGRVLGWIDCAGLLPAAQRLNAESVLNGIAYDAQHDRLFVTGKQWPYIFEVKIGARK